MRPMNTERRAAIVLMSWVGLGAIVSILLAWFLGNLRGSYRGLVQVGATAQCDGNKWYVIDVLSHRGLTLVVSRAAQDEKIAREAVQIRRADFARQGPIGLWGKARWITEAAPPPWSGPFRPLIGSAPRAQVAQGWPMRCLRCDISMQEEPYRLFNPRNRRVLICSVVLPCGLFVNALLFGISLMMIWRLIIFVRFYRRRRKDQCVACGYSLEGLEGSWHCPECGAHARSGSDMAKSSGSFRLRSR